MFFKGLGMGFMVQNLVLAMQNTVKVTDIGTASASAALFRSVGGAAGVAALRAMYETAFGDATGVVFTTSAFVVVVVLLCIALIREVSLSTTV
ncbi:hypothetical protein GCM10025778_02750 [Paeniglutamicibacter antarcticus]|uniref:Major facilitator superfamily (MFS) profile domain-containing protein n=2 Tax=Paeniglutamicibacter antarcticus TaxID=494023 RepID=A0ABP9TL63_9MICC